MNWIQLFLRHEELGNKMRGEDIRKDLFYFVAFVRLQNSWSYKLEAWFKPNQNRRKLIQYL